MQKGKPMQKLIELEPVELMRELAVTELDIVSGGAAAAAGGLAAGAVHNLGIATSGGVTAVNFGALFGVTFGGWSVTIGGPTTDAAIGVG
jgi:hypothetical protein